MGNGRGRKAIFLLLAVTFTACSSGISQQAREQVTYNGPFAAVQKTPEKYRGEILLLGGKVIKISNQEGASELIVLELNLGNQDRPRDNDQSQGRFLIRSTRFIDPAIFPPGTLITVVGRLQGSETRLIGKMRYTYPVIEPIETKKWSAGSEPTSRFHFGIGIGTVID
jgi:outer membrane lipoprotein